MSTNIFKYPYAVNKVNIGPLNIAMDKRGPWSQKG